MSKVAPGGIGSFVPALAKGGGLNTMSFWMGSEHETEPIDTSGMSSGHETPPVDTYEMDVIEFAAVEYLCMEDDGVVPLTVARRGSCEKRVELTWSNTDINHSPGEFQKLSGSVTLEAGQTYAVFDFQVHRCPLFTTEQLQDIELAFKDPSNFKACTVLGDLKRTRVVTLNVDKFPHGVGDTENRLAVLTGFWAHNYHLFTPSIVQGLKWRLAPGLSFICNLFVSQYLIKTVSAAYVFNENHRGEDADLPVKYYVNIVLLGALSFVSFLLNMYADLQFAKLRLGGKSTKALRACVMDTVTQLTPLGEEEYDVGRVMKIADVQVEDAVQASFVAWFSLYANCVKLVLVIGFIVYTSVSQYLLSDDERLLLLVFIPFLMICGDALLLEYTIRPAADKNSCAMEADDAWSSFMVQASFMRQVITSFRKGFVVTKHFEAIHTVFNGKAFQAAQFSKCTQWAANTIPTFTATLVTVLVGLLVASGSMTVPVFVVFVRSINSFGPTLGAVFGDLFTIGKGYASIKKIAYLLNQNTRRKELLRGQKRRKELMQDYRSMFDKTKEEGEEAFNPEAPEVLMHRVTYVFSEKDQSVLVPLNLQLKAGQVVALQGTGSVGKKLVLRLLARHFIPTEGFTNYPSRWRQRFIDATPALFGGDMNRLKHAEMEGREAMEKELRTFSGTLEYNLKFGHQFKHPDHEVWDVEIWNLLTQLGVSKDLRGYTAQDFAFGSPGRRAKKLRLIGLNGERLSTTDRALLTIARALLSSVDLLLISNVLDLLGPQQAEKVVAVLKELTTNRCLSCLATEAASTPMHLRKQKLVIFSTKIKELEDLADERVDLNASVLQRKSEVDLVWRETILRGGGSGSSRMAAVAALAGAADATVAAGTTVATKEDMVRRASQTIALAPLINRGHTMARNEGDTQDWVEGSSSLTPLSLHLANAAQAWRLRRG